MSALRRLRPVGVDGSSSITGLPGNLLGAVAVWLANIVSQESRLSPRRCPDWTRVIGTATNTVSGAELSWLHWVNRVSRNAILPMGPSLRGKISRTSTGYKSLTQKLLVWASGP